MCARVSLRILLASKINGFLVATSIMQNDKFIMWSLIVGGFMSINPKLEDKNIEELLV